MSGVAYGRYEEAYKAIHSALSGLMTPESGQKITKLAFTWNVDGSLATMTAYDGANAIFTLCFTWNVDNSLKEVARS
ncbi:MAG: hypothetical protein ACE14S_00535 [Candidatus Bathyarchaeia archaeon]